MNPTGDSLAGSRSTDRRLAALVEAGMVLASEFELDALLQRIADLAREVIGARYVRWVCWERTAGLCASSTRGSRSTPPI